MLFTYPRASQCIHCVSCSYHTRDTGIKMPDVLAFTKGLPISCIPISCYEKAYERLKMHSDKRRMVVALTASSFLCITTIGLEQHKKLSKALVDTYQCVSGSNPTYHRISQPAPPARHQHTTLQTDRIAAYQQHIVCAIYVSGSNYAVRASDQRHRSTTLNRLQMFATVWSYARWPRCQARAFHAWQTH